jgi:hypothetical protein
MKQQPKASSFHVHSVPLLNGNPVMHWPRASSEATTNEFTPGQDEKSRGGSIMPPTQAEAPDPDEHALPFHIVHGTWLHGPGLALSALDSRPSDPRFPFLDLLGLDSSSNPPHPLMTHAPIFIPTSRNREHLILAQCGHRGRYHVGTRRLLHSIPCLQHCSGDPIVIRYHIPQIWIAPTIFVRGKGISAASSTRTVQPKGCTPGSPI